MEKVTKHGPGREKRIGEALKLECTNCGGTLELEDKTHALCPYCGRRYLIDEAKGTVIYIQVDYSGNEELKGRVNRARRLLVGFLAMASVVVLIIFGFNIAARRSVFSTSDEDLPADAGGELLVIFCKDIFGKNFDEITPEELESIRYLRCSYEREGDREFNVISYSFTDYQDCEDEREFQRTVKKWTYRTRMVSWPSDYSMFTGLTRVDTTGSAWLSMLHFAEGNQISYVETLRCYLDHNMNLTRTAAKMFVHRTTLIERIRRIEALLRVDLEDPDERLYLLLILKRLERKDLEGGGRIR